MKKQLGLRIEGHLKDGLDERAQKTGTPVTKVLEDYIEAGLARDSGELIEQNSLPAIRAAIREEVSNAMQELYQQLSADLQKSIKRGDERLIPLLTKAARSAGIAQRMLLSLAGKLVSQDFASRTYDDAREKAGRDIAKPE